MSSELDILTALRDETHLLDDCESGDVAVQRSAQFTLRAAWALKDLGWGNLRETFHKNVDGLAVDKLIHRTGEVRDIIVASDMSKGRNVSWNLVDHLDPSRWVEPVNPGTAPPPALPPSDVSALVTAIYDLRDEVTQLATQLESLRTRPWPKYSAPIPPNPLGIPAGSIVLHPDPER